MRVSQTPTQRLIPDTRAFLRVFGMSHVLTSNDAVTGLFLAQAALTILEDDVDLGGGGVFTPACLGQGFVDRVDAAGFRFETKTISD